MTTANDTLIYDTTARISVSVSYLTHEGVNTPVLTIEDERLGDLIQCSIDPYALRALGNRCLGISELCLMEDVDE